MTETQTSNGNELEPSSKCSSTDSFSIRFTNWLNFGFLALLPLTVWPWWDDSTELPKMVFGSFYFAVVSLLGLGQARAILNHQQLKGSLFWFSLSTTLYVGCFAILGNADGWDAALKWICFGLAGVTLVIGTNNDQHRLSKLDGPVVIGWLLTATYSWFQRLGLDPIHWSNPDLSQVRTIAGLGNPNHLGLHIAFLGPLALDWLVMRRDTLTKRVGGAILWSLASSVIWFSGTRASMVAFGVSMAAMLLLIKRYRPKQLKLLLACTLAAGLVVLAWFEIPSSQTNEFQSWNRVASIASASDASSKARLILWRVALVESLHRPLGQGAGWFGFRYLNYRQLEPENLRVANRRPENPHNFYLETLFDGGILTLAALAISVAAAIQILVKRVTIDESQATGTHIALLCSLLALLVNVSFIGLNLTSGIVMVWILANCDSQRAHPKPHFEKRAPIVDWFTKMLLILLAIVSVSSGLTTAHHETLVWLAEDQIYAFRNGKPAVAAPFVAVQRSLDYCMQADGTSLPWNQKRQTRRLADLYGFGSFSLQQQGDARFIKLDQQAELYYRRASQDYAYDAYSWSGLGRFLERNLTEARMSSVTQAYLKAHQLDRFNLNFVLDLSRWYWRLGKYSESLQACEEALKNAPHSEEAQVHRALCLHSLGKSAEAEEAWQQITGLHQGDPLTKPW